jgi:hypothetical protein
MYFLYTVILSVNTQDDPFPNWSDLLNRPVYSIDGKKLGFLRKTLSDYLFVAKGLLNLTKYFIPVSAAESVSKKGIRLNITAEEVRSKYSYKKMKNVLISSELIPKLDVEHRQYYDRFLTLRYSASRNRLAAGIAFVSGILFLISGYKANLAIYSLIREEVMIYTAKEFWAFVLAPIGILAIISQLGGIVVLIGAGLFAANRVNLGKFCVIIGTGQGLFTIGLRIISELWSGRWPLENNYIIWLTSSAAGLGVLFGVMSQSISKGSGESIASKGLRFAIGRKRKEDE